MLQKCGLNQTVLDLLMQDGPRLCQALPATRGGGAASLLHVSRTLITAHNTKYQVTDMKLSVRQSIIDMIQ